MIKCMFLKDHSGLKKWIHKKKSKLRAIFPPSLKGLASYQLKCCKDTLKKYRVGGPVTSLYLNVERCILKEGKG